MKKNKIIYIIIALLFLIILSLFMIKTFIIDRSENDSKKGIVLEAGVVENIEEFSGDLPEFSFKIEGAYIGEIDKEIISSYEIPVYEFDAGIDSGFRTETNHYLGVRLGEFLEKQSITNYRDLIINSLDGYKRVYRQDEIDDYMFLIFKRDGKIINDDNPVVLLVVDEEYNKYSLEKLTSITIRRNNINNVENDQTEDGTSTAPTE